MKIRDLKLLAVPPHASTTVSSTGDGRLRVLDLEPDERMPEGEAEGPGWLMPIAGVVEILDSGGKRAVAGPASLVELEPEERLDVRARTRARLVIVAGANGSVGESGPGEAERSRS